MPWASAFLSSAPHGEDAASIGPVRTRRDLLSTSPPTRARAEETIAAMIDDAIGEV